MIREKLRLFDHLYSLAKLYSSDSTARRFLSLEGDEVLPLSISHGVDFGQTFDPLDVHGVEPIHWSTCQSVHQRAKLVKPSILLPHPWTMQVCGLQVPPGNGTLLIGPPPGPDNDRLLLESVANQIDGSWSILVKPRGKFHGSLEFWESHGVTPIYIPSSTQDYYGALFGVLSKYRSVVGATLSSVLFFAASIAREIRLVKDYFYEAIEVADYMKDADLESEYARNICGVFAGSHQSSIKELSQNLLGFDHAGEGLRTKQIYFDLVDDLKEPLHSRAERLIPYALRVRLAQITGRPQFVNLDGQMLLQRISRRRTSVMRMNEIDVLLNGQNVSNFSLRQPAGAERLGQPGSAALEYES